MKTNAVISHEEFQQAVRQVSQQDTSSHPILWSPENPLCGHCAIVGLTAYTLLDLEFIYAPLKGTPFFRYAMSHYANRNYVGAVIDFTREQFGDTYPELTFYPMENVGRLLQFEYLPDLKRRYTLFWNRLTEVL